MSDIGIIVTFILMCTKLAVIDNVTDLSSTSKWMVEVCMEEAK